ncbi:aromatic motif membrane protein [Mycoplasma phocimorsus]|uniref:aromatic motif membrane protein n=1 Tax=Mycoplasma phocimorsus TaxID=3045839 RepID=UPI0024BF2654|nr:aromatic motif membrane protein [Mycoplasma phocimorsus]MDJ1648675.1 hypothetical protein [Mycoplasma phocimorsus]
MKVKKLLSLTTLISPLVTISCINTSNSEKLAHLIDKQYDYYPNKVSTKEEKTQEIIEKVTKLVFGTNAVERTTFLNIQNSAQHDEYMKAELNKFKMKYTTAKRRISKEDLEAYSNLISKNWLWVFKHIGKFSLSFYEWLLYPDKGKGGKHSPEYIEYINDLDYPDVSLSSNYGKIFATNIFDEVVEGEESNELGDVTILYIRKANNVFRLRIDHVTNELKMNAYVWGFPRKATSSNISLRVINNIAHAALVHGFNFGFKEFEDAYINKVRYGAPAKLLLLWNGEK